MLRIQYRKEFTKIFQPKHRSYTAMKDLVRLYLVVLSLGSILPSIVLSLAPTTLATMKTKPSKMNSRMGEIYHAGLSPSGKKVLRPWATQSKDSVSDTINDEADGVPSPVSSSAAAATISLLLGMILTFSSQPAVAVTAADDSLFSSASLIATSTTTVTTTLPSLPPFTNSYVDPDHPLCERRINVGKDGATFTLSGTAVGPTSMHSETIRGRGCSQEEIKEYGGIRNFIIRGQVVDNGRVLSATTTSSSDGTTVKLEGRWDEQEGSDTGGVFRWNDDRGSSSSSSKWIVTTPPEKTLQVQIGEYIFLAYVGFSLLAGIKGFFFDGWRPKL